jgi:hypothetical protein
MLQSKMILGGRGGYTLYADVPQPKQLDFYGLRPCFKEDIRLGAARFWLQQQVKSADADERLNRMVDAYNRLCGTRKVSGKGNMAGVKLVNPRCELSGTPCGRNASRAFRGGNEMRFILATLIALTVVYFCDAEYNQGRLFDGVQSMGRAMFHSFR